MFVFTRWCACHPIGMLVTLVGVRPYLSMCLLSIGTFTRRYACHPNGMLVTLVSVRPCHPIGTFTLRRQFYVWETCEWNLSFHLSLVGEGMLGSSKVTSKRLLSVHLESSDDEVLKMEARKKKQVEIRKAATLRAQQLGGLLVSLAIVGQKRKQPMDKGQSSKKVQGPYDRLDQEEMFPTMPEPPRHGIERDQDFLLMWMHANTTNEDELDEEFDPLPSRKTGEVLKGRYDRLRIIAVRMQTVLGDLATQGERLQSLLSLYSCANASKTSCQLSSSSPKLLEEDVCKNW
nr:protein quirky [Quercus suber]